MLATCTTRQTVREDGAQNHRPWFVQRDQGSGVAGHQKILAISERKPITDPDKK